MKSFEVIERDDLQIWNGREIHHKSYYCRDSWSNMSEGAVRFYDIAKGEKKVQELQSQYDPAETTFRLVTRYADKRRISMDRLNVREQVGKTIRNARKAKGMTQAELAEKASITMTHVKDIEECAFAVRVDILNRICKALDIHITLPIDC